MSKPKIFIGGDSWACGEWPEGPSLHASHKGLEEYFIQDGYSVINTARGGASNHDSVSLLSSAVKSFYSDNDIVIWVQTDPIRNVKQQLAKAVEQAGGIARLMRKLAQEDYARLDRLLIPVHAVGGLYNIQLDLLPPNVHCLAESWVRLLVPSWNEQAILDSDWTVDDVQLSTFKDQELVKQCIDELIQMTSNRAVYNNTIFHPNGNHPNREGHRILYNYIKERLEL